MIRKIIGKIKNFGLDFTEARELFSSQMFLRHEDEQREIYGRVKEQTMIGALGVLANLDAVDYIASNKIPGAFVECGVWRGGSVAAMLMRLAGHGDQGRDVFLFDTFAGMTAPTDVDKRGNIIALEKYKQTQKSDHNAWCYAPLEGVKNTIQATGYDESKVHYIKGDVLETLKSTEVPDISLLRLDTDWYESTKVELEVLYPKVVQGGVIILDDYGAWEGARLAADEYFGKLGYRPLMFRVDTTRRMFVKTH